MGRVVVYLPYDGHAELPGPLPSGIKPVRWIHNGLTEQSGIVLEGDTLPWWEVGVVPMMVTWDDVANWPEVLERQQQEAWRHEMKMAAQRGEGGDAHDTP